jgi:integral membrane protein
MGAVYYSPCGAGPPPPSARPDNNLESDQVAATAVGRIAEDILCKFFEGLTTVVLFFVAMPMKYVAGDPRLVPPVGLVHGIAFLVYLAAMVLAFWGRHVGAAAWIRTTVAALIPLGTFLNDPFLKRLSARTSARRAPRGAVPGD